MSLHQLIDELGHDHVVAHSSLVLGGFRELVVVRQAHVVFLQLVEAMCHVGATCIYSGVIALVKYVLVDVLLFLCL